MDWFQVVNKNEKEIIFVVVILVVMVIVIIVVIIIIIISDAREPNQGFVCPWAYALPLSYPTAKRPLFDCLRDSITSFLV